MKITHGAKNSVRFKAEQDTKRAQVALDITLRKPEFSIFLSNYVNGFDDDTGDLLYFFPTSDINKLKEVDKKNFVQDIKKNWIDAKFQILAEKDLSEKNKNFHVGFRSLFFRLKSLI